MATNLKDYLVWLKWLLALGSNLTPILAIIMEFYTKLKPYLPAPPTAPEVPGSDGGLAITKQIQDCEGALGTTLAVTEGGQEIVADVLEAESEVLSLIAPSAEGTLAVRDFSGLRSLFAFLQATGLLDKLFKMFAGT